MKPDSSSEDCAHSVAYKAERLDAQWREFDEAGPQVAADYEYWAQLLECVNKLGVDERRVLLLQAQRLAKGKPEYGELVLATDSRNFCREAAEEVLDMGQYLSILLLRWSDNAALKGGE